MAQHSFINKIGIPFKPSQKIHKKINFVHSFRPIYIVSRAFGLMPFSMAYQSNGAIQKPTVCMLDILWFLFSIGVNGFGIYTLSASIIRKPLSKEPAHLVVLSIYLIVILGLFLGLFTIIFDMCNRSKLVDIVKNFIIFDNKV